MAQNISSSFRRLYSRTTSIETSTRHVSFGGFEKQQSEDDNENQDLRSLRIVIDHFSYQLGRELNLKGVSPFSK